MTRTSKPGFSSVNDAIFGKKSYGRADSNLKRGALIGTAAGVLAISVYGLVNYALVKNWTLDITILKVVWGRILGGLSGLFVIWMKSVIFKGT
ncbi:MAG: DUF2177 family protein [Patescibacteria group bacterium]|nr:DUF2177 family protein [Patescibacteria group bacterium]